MSEAFGVSSHQEKVTNESITEFMDKSANPTDAIKKSIAEVEALMLDWLEWPSLGPAPTPGGSPQILGGLEPFSFIEDEDAEVEQLNAVQQSTLTETKIRVAMDSGAVRSVVHPSVIPAGVKIVPNTSGKHFSGAGGDVIERYGDCCTLMTGQHGKVIHRWSLAKVAPVGQLTGTCDGPGNHDVLFNNRTCVVVPAGVVDAVLKQIKPVAEYKREGGLYLGEVTLSDFVRQGPEE